MGLYHRKNEFDPIEAASFLIDQLVELLFSRYLRDTEPFIFSMAAIQFHSESYK